MQIDMAQQDVSYSTLVKQCKHRAAVCDEEKAGMLMKSQAALLYQLAKMQSWLSHLQDKALSYTMLNTRRIS